LPDRLMDMLAGITADDDIPRSGVIVGVNTDGTVDLGYLGGLCLNVPVVSTYTPSTGDVVQVMRRGPSSLIVIGATRTTNVAGGSVSADFVISYNVDAVPAVITGGGTAGSSGTLTVRPAVAGSYRRTDGWSRSDVSPGSLLYFHSARILPRCMVLWHKCILAAKGTHYYFCEDLPKA
jgi:hypothetical protein